MEHPNKHLLNKSFKIPQFTGEFAEMQRYYNILEGKEWEKRSLGFNKYVIRHSNPIPKDNDIEALLASE